MGNTSSQSDNIVKKLIALNAINEVDEDCYAFNAIVCEKIKETGFDNNI